MNSNAKIRLESVNLSGQQEIDTLLEAARDLQNANEANFEQIKNKTWYKRLWQMVTFSKDNQKIMAKNIDSLAGLQDIVFKLLLMSSEDSVAIYDYVMKNSEQLHLIAKKHKDMYAKLIFRYDSRPDIRNMKKEHQDIIINAIFKLVNISSADKEVDNMVQEYLNNLHNCCHATINPRIREFEYDEINNLHIEGHKLLAYILNEVMALSDDNSEKLSAISEVKQHLAISDKNLEIIENRIKDIVKLQGKRFIVLRYAEIKIDDDFFIIGENIIFESDEQKFLDKEIINITSNNETNIKFLPDNTKEQYSEVREIIEKHLPAVYSAWEREQHKKQAKKIKSFIEENKLPLEIDTVIDTTIGGSAKKGLLFTTHAIYYKPGGKEEIIKIKYSSIKYDRNKVIHNENQKPIAISIVCDEDNKIIGISDYSDINMSAFGAMLHDLSKLTEYAPTDSPMSIIDMDYSVKLPYLKLLIYFMTEHGHSCAELYRFAWNLGFTDEQITELKQYKSNNAEDIITLLSQINERVPYGSNKSLRCALIQDLFGQLPFITKSTDLTIPENEFIKNIANLYGFNNDEQLAGLKDAGQMKYNVLNGRIKSQKDVKKYLAALGTLTTSDSISLYTIYGSTTLITAITAKTGIVLSWIPVIGWILGPVVYTALAGKILYDKKKENAEFKKIVIEAIDMEIKNYKEAINKISKNSNLGLMSEKKVLEENMSIITKIEQNLRKDDDIKDNKNEKAINKDVNFRMTIDEVISITGRGIVAFGTIELGKIETNDKVYVINSKTGIKLNSAITGIEISRKLVNSACICEEVALMLRGLTENDVNIGDVVIK